MNYTVTRQLTSNQEVHGVKAVLVANSATIGVTADLYTYGLSGVSAASRITVPASNTVLFPIQICGVSFGASSISAWALS